jgi:hypothetical protein
MRITVDKESQENVKKEMKRLKKIEKAYEEMLAVFIPDLRYEGMLDSCDDDLKSGRRFWPIVHGHTPRIKDIRRWLEARKGE